MVKRALDVIKKHDTYRNKCINLVASENVLSPDAKRGLISDMGARYFFQRSYNTITGIDYTYRGTKAIKEIIEIGKKLCNKIFSSNYAYLYPLSGHTATFSILTSFCKNGDTIICTNPDVGGYPGLDRDKLPGILGLNTNYFPMQDNGIDIDIEKTMKMVLSLKPQLVFLSSAMPLFAFPVRELAEVCKKVNALLVYDASHTLGLIAGGRFQSPFKEGADVLLGSTHKSFPGPQGGLILTKDYFEKIEKAGHFISVDNQHFNRIAALVVTLHEMEQYGKEYASAVINNSKSLASSLAVNGISVKYREREFTDSHQFILETKDNYAKFTRKLEEANIIVDNSGRIGVCEMTRYGMGENEMIEIAEFITRVFFGKNPADVRKDVISLRGEYKNCRYC